MKRFAAAVMLLGVLMLGAGEKPVGVWCGRNGQRLTELVRKTVLNPQWSADKPVQKDFSEKDRFDSFSAVVFMLGFGNPVWRGWTAARIAEAEKYVKDGGTLILLLDGAANPGGDTGPFARLFGAKTWSEFTGKAGFPAEDWKECGIIPQVHEHMLSGKNGYGALKDLTTAKMLIGNESGALAAENRLGKGRVLFMNVRLSESLTPYVQHYNRHANAALEQLFPFARKIHEFLMGAGPALSAEKRERWEWKPLGPAPDKAAWKKPVIHPVKSARKYEQLPGEPLKLVENGEPKALIILGSLPGDRGGAGVLNNLLKKMSGAILPAVPEKAVREVDGKWQWRRKLYDCRIVFAATENEEIRAEGNTIRIGSSNPMQGTYTFLREALGYRMLWPGQSGEVYSVGKDVSVAPFALTDAPFFRQRYIRNGLSARRRPWKAPDGSTVDLAVPVSLLERGHLTGFDPREAAALRKGHGAWFPAQRLGGSIAGIGGGSFGGWKAKYGKTHPEYFALQFDGTRQARSHDIRICKANPGVVKQAAEEARAALKKKPDTRYYSLSPSDGGYDIFCMCPRCREWDPTGGREVTRRVFLGRNRPVFRYPRMTDRVLRFTSEVARELWKTHPDVKVRYLAYANYFSPPEYYRDIPDNLSVTFVGFQYLNRNALEYDRKVWDYWAGVSSELVLRPNYLLGGAGLPMIYVHEMAKDIRHCAETGMIGSDFDSLTHHWATLGLNYYVLAQLLWDPAQDVDAIIDDYCTKGFGPAAPELKAYFALCEKLTSAMAERRAENIKALEDLTNDRRESLLATFIQVFTPEKLAELAGLLEQAGQKTAEGSPERKRVDFITAGFRFTMDRVDFYRKYNLTKDKAERKALAEAQVKFWHETFSAYPYAVNIPGLAIDQYYSFWRWCSWKAEPMK
ncbi:MAG: DUF4838 domain-containing protein [Lentisphaeria bacterium]|nr:DUF4838 domain-containing protein [Lentisphaeria bacterium]